MLNDGYLIPANTKKGQLILGMFTGPDLIIFAVGASISVLLLLILGADDTVTSIICIIPAVFCGFLVMPVPNYRNVITFFISMITFYNNQKIYKWRGWCFYEQQRK